MDKKTAMEVMLKTQHAYDKIAFKFDQTRLKHPWAEFWQFKELIKFGDKVLDLGCGNGRLIKVLQNLEINYTGVDFSHELILRAKKNFPGYKFIVGNILDFDLGREEYDHIFFLATLHHIPSLGLRLKVLRDIYNSLKPRGYLFMTNWNMYQYKFNGMRIKNNFKKFFGGNKKLDYNDIFIPFTVPGEDTTVQRYIHCFSNKELEYLGSLVGFKIIEQGYGFKDFNLISIWQK